MIIIVDNFTSLVKQYENILNREYKAEKPNQKMVSDITYVWTGEGWLYVVGILDLYS